MLYNYGDESITEHFGSVRNNKLVIGKCEYSTVIMPYMQSLTENTLKLLTEFSQNGGKLYFIGEMPSLVNGVKDERLKRLKAEKGIRLCECYNRRKRKQKYPLHQACNG